MQCIRNGEGEPEREKEVTATMTTIAMIAMMTTMTTMTTMTDRGTKTADQSSAGMGSEQGRMSDRGGTAGTAGRGLTMVLQQSIILHIISYIIYHYIGSAGRGLTMVLRRVAQHNNLTMTISS